MELHNDRRLLLRWLLPVHQTKKACSSFSSFIYSYRLLCNKGQLAVRGKSIKHHENLSRNTLLLAYFTDLFFSRGLQEESFAIPVQMLSQLAFSSSLPLSLTEEVSVLSCKKQISGHEITSALKFCFPVLQPLTFKSFPELIQKAASWSSKVVSSYYWTWWSQ